MSKLCTRASLTRSLAKQMRQLTQMKSSKHLIIHLMIEQFIIFKTHLLQISDNIIKERNLRNTIWSDKLNIDKFKEKIGL